MVGSERLGESPSVVCHLSTIKPPVHPRTVSEDSLLGGKEQNSCEAALARAGPFSYLRLDVRVRESKVLSTQNCPRISSDNSF